MTRALIRRLWHWTTGADCTCGKRSAPDFMHAAGCKHILFRRWHRR